jgi:para-aminobenzoate synthetase component 1
MAKDVYFSVGGGIVYDSKPQSEYEETLVKAEALKRALKGYKNEAVCLVR